MGIPSSGRPAPSGGPVCSRSLLSWAARTQGPHQPYDELNHGGNMATTLLTAQQSTSNRRVEAQGIARETGLIHTLFTRQEGKCFWCGLRMAKATFYDVEGKAIDPQRKATIEHVVPLCAGGATDEVNCRAACRGCNELRGKFTSGQLQREAAEASHKLGLEQELTKRLGMQLLGSVRREEKARKRIDSLLSHALKMREALDDSESRQCSCLVCRVYRGISRLLRRVPTPRTPAHFDLEGSATVENNGAQVAAPGIPLCIPEMSDGFGCGHSD
jgi:hypothetical protein